MKKNIANIVTLSRIFMVFIVVSLLFCTDCKYSYILALVLSAFLMCFDALDGYLARKLNISSRFGALLDIMGDRIVENVYWISFCALGWLNVAIPIIVLTRGIITDSLRTIAFEKGYTAFGKTTMMQGKSILRDILLGKFLEWIPRLTSP